MTFLPMNNNLPLITALFLLCTNLVQAQSATPSDVSQKKVAFVHSPLKLQSLPAPGLPINITVSLRNTRETERPLKALIIKDGKLLEYVVPNARFNEREEPTYVIPTHAPLAEIKYQFNVRTADGAALNSEFYTIRRRCIPTTLLTDSSIPEDLEADDKFKLLINKAKGLERDIQRYETANRILDEIKELTKR